VIILGKENMPKCVECETEISETDYLTNGPLCEECKNEEWKTDISEEEWERRNKEYGKVNFNGDW
jgi:hypothetical protein